MQKHNGTVLAAPLLQEKQLKVAMNGLGITDQDRLSFFVVNFPSVTLTL